MRIKILPRLGCSTVLLASLAACSGGDAGADQPEPESTLSAQSFQNSFGSRFAAIFDKPLFSEPVEITQDDVPPLAPTSDPVGL